MRCEIDIKKIAYASAEGGGRPLRPSLDPPLVWNRAVLYSVQETCTRKILYKKPCQTVKFLVQVDLYKFLVQVSSLCVTTISLTVLPIAVTAAAIIATKA